MAVKLGHFKKILLNNGEDAYLVIYHIEANLLVLGVEFSRKKTISAKYIDTFLNNIYELFPEELKYDFKRKDLTYLCIENIFGENAFNSIATYLTTVDERNKQLDIFKNDYYIDRLETFGNVLWLRNTTDGSRYPSDVKPAYYTRNKTVYNTSTLNPSSLFGIVPIFWIEKEK